MNGTRKELGDSANQQYLSQQSTQVPAHAVLEDEPQVVARFVPANESNTSSRGKGHSEPKHQSTILNFTTSRLPPKHTMSGI